MFKIFQVMKEEGEDAVRRTIWILFAAFLLVVAVALVSVASSIALSALVPMPVALLISAGGVVIISLLCLLIAERDHQSSHAEAAKAAPPATGFNLLDSGLVDQATQKLMMEKVKTKPVGVLAIAAAAGLAVAALDAFDDQ